MDANGSFEQMMARLQAGDPAAASHIFHRFAQRLLALARVRLDGRMRQKMDPEDVLQSVYRSFFRRHRDGQFDFGGWDDLWVTLTVITVRKCGRRRNYFHAARRDVERELPQPADDGATGWEGVARDPTPAEAATLAETVEQLFRGLDVANREIVSLHLQGYTIAEISVRVSYSQRTVRRTLEMTRRRLRRLRDDPND